jgi:hypothetical protein
MLLGAVLLILPALWMLPRLVFISSVVVLEGRRNRDAIRRTFALTKGQVWRLIGLTLLPTLPAYLVTIAAVLVIIILGEWLGGPDSALVKHGPRLMADVGALGLVLPVGWVTIVLLYYDQRSRRESYDAQALSEDLMR